MVKACGQHVSIGQRLQRTRLEIGQYLLAFGLGRLACNARCLDALLNQFFADVLSVLYASAKEQPRYAPICSANCLGNHLGVAQVIVHRRLQL